MTKRETWLWESSRQTLCLFLLTPPSCKQCTLSRKPPLAMELKATSEKRNWPRFKTLVKVLTSLKITSTKDMSQAFPISHPPSRVLTSRAEPQHRQPIEEAQRRRMLSNNNKFSFRRFPSIFDWVKVAGDKPSTLQLTSLPSLNGTS